MEVNPTRCRGRDHQQPQLAFPLRNPTPRRAVNRRQPSLPNSKFLSASCSLPHSRHKCNNDSKDLQRGHHQSHNRTMEGRTTINRVRNLFRKSADVEQEYEPLDGDANTLDEEVRRPVLILPEDEEGGGQSEPFSWLEYSIFLLLGIAMLWAWYV